MYVLFFFINFESINLLECRGQINEQKRHFLKILRKQIKTSTLFRS
jgi:hypothetical protein